MSHDERFDFVPYIGMRARKFGPRIDQKAIEEMNRSGDEFREFIEGKVKERLQQIYAQREEILTAFVAKYGCGPEEAVQVQRQTPDGMRWWVERVVRPEASQ